MKTAGIVLKGRVPAKATEYFKNPDTPNAEYQMIRGLFTDAELRTLGWNSDSQKSNVKWQNVKEMDPGSRQTQPSSSGMTINQSFNHPFEIGFPLFTDHHSLITVSALETIFYMRNQLLRDSDVFSMAHSLELRVPFVDHLLYGAVLPYLDGGFDMSFPKKMLVEGVGDLPDEIVHRPKQGFTFPFADWMKHGQIKDAINESLMSSKTMFDKNELNNLINKFKSGKLHWSRIWALYIVNQF
jgi:asparagine synthase (glutamine-hydrolysing)